MDEPRAFPALGATKHGFRVWAPRAREVAVRIEGRDHRLTLGEHGVFETSLAVPAGTDYAYVLDGAEPLPDPCSRSQPHGIGRPSRVVDPSRFPWSDDDWKGLTLDDLVIYELHVGTFSDVGTFAGVIERLPRLRELGVTAIEVMPIATFPGMRNWGYDGVYAYAPHPVYGGPDGFAALVDAAHHAGIGVILDVVYNHIGPGSEAIATYGPYFTSRHRTFWGEALDYAERGVREWAIQNAEMWVRDYHVDGLRLDAIHALYDDEDPHVLAELADRVRAVRPRTLVISETGVGDLRPTEEWGHDAQWADEFHHLVHVLLTGENEGYYADYRPSTAELARQLARTPAEKLVICSQNHDQVGNRALGDRPERDELRIRAAALLFAPQTPLLFMGEEYGERRPFQFFTDHTDPAIAAATREGRKREFESFAGFSGTDVPDPQDPQTFERSKLRPEQGDEELFGYYRELLALRRRLPREVSAEADEAARTLRIRRGDGELRLDFSNRSVTFLGCSPL